MDFNPHRESLLAHYVALAAEPGWKQYVLARVQELARQPHGLYADFPERLQAAINPPLPQESQDAVRTEGSYRVPTAAREPSQGVPRR